MTNEQAEQAKFEGWAILEIFGHQRYAGFVSTQAFGTAVMFRCDVPALEERERVTTRPSYIESTYAPDESTYAPAGTKVKAGAVQGYTKFFGVGAIYALSPCSQEACLKAVEEIQPRPVMSIELPPDKSKALAAAEADDVQVEVCPHTGIESDNCLCPRCTGQDEGEQDDNF